MTLNVEHGWVIYQQLRHQPGSTQFLNVFLCYPCLPLAFASSTAGESNRKASNFFSSALILAFARCCRISHDDFFLNVIVLNQGQAFASCAKMIILVLLGH
jgi:hypothetical protein